jgi:hypothetical protein
MIFPRSGRVINTIRTKCSDELNWCRDAEIGFGFDTNALFHIPLLTEFPITYKVWVCEL